MTSPQVETYNLTASNGRHIRKATKVTFSNGQVIRFVERIPSKREAIATAQRWLTEGLA